MQITGLFGFVVVTDNRHIKTTDNDVKEKSKLLF